MTRTSEKRLIILGITYAFTTLLLKLLERCSYKLVCILTLLLRVTLTENLLNLYIQYILHVNNYDNLPFTAVPHKLTNRPNHIDTEGDIIKEGDTTPKMIPPYEEIKSVTNTNTINADAMNENELLGTEQLYIDQPDEKRENELLDNDDELFSLANLTQLTPKRRTDPINVTETRRGFRS